MVSRCSVFDVYWGMFDIRYSIHGIKLNNQNSVSTTKYRKPSNEQQEPKTSIK